MNKTIVITALIAFIIGGGVGYEGAQFAQGGGLGTSARAAQFRSGQFSGGGTFANRRTSASGSSMTRGTVLSSGNGSVTVKESNGSTKIMLLTHSTDITKGVTGTPSDLAAGTNISAFGTDNSDGSMTATSVQILPASTTLAR